MQLVNPGDPRHPEERLPSGPPTKGHMHSSATVSFRRSPTPLETLVSGCGHPRAGSRVRAARKTLEQYSRAFQLSVTMGPVDSVEETRPGGGWENQLCQNAEVIQEVAGLPGQEAHAKVPHAQGC